MSTGEGVYRKLQRHLDKMPVGYPATDSGVELRILKRLFTPEEAEIALGLSALPETVGRIHRRVKKTGISVEDLELALDRMASKGAIMGGRRLDKGDGKKRYSKALLAIGMYEFQVDRLTKGLQQDFWQYMNEGFAEAFHSKKTTQLRTIPVNETVIPDRQVGTYDGARRIINDCEGPFAILNCICRQGMDLLGKPCRQTDIRRTCLALAKIGYRSIDSGVGQALTKEETLRLLDRANEIGMVLQPENTQNPRFICFCCGCCCGVLASARIFPRPAEYVHSNYYAEANPSLCTGCETCSSRCQMEAVTFVDDISRVDRDRCIGCGLCVSTCPSGAMELRTRESVTVPPEDGRSLYRRIMTERFGFWGTAKIMGKALLGMKI